MEDVSEYGQSNCIFHFLFHYQHLWFMHFVCFIKKFHPGCKIANFFLFDSERLASPRFYVEHLNTARGGGGAVGLPAKNKTGPIPGGVDASSLIHAWAAGALDGADSRLKTRRRGAERWCSCGPSWAAACFVKVSRRRWWRTAANTNAGRRLITPAVPVAENQVCHLVSCR